MRNPQDTKNLLLVWKYVKNHFNLTTESVRLFRHRVLYEPNIAPEFKSIIGDAPDLRARFEISREAAKNFDEGWRDFSSRHADFIEHYGVTYQNFVDNKIVIKKNNIKLFKVMFDYYISTPERAAEFMERTGTHWPNFHSFATKAKKIVNELGKENGAEYEFRSAIFDNRKKKFEISYIDVEDRFGFPHRAQYAEVEAKKLIDISNFDYRIQESLLADLNRIGSKALPKKKKFQLVVSCNPADIFMASTSEHWGSCINLDSDYSECYWGGLPGGIVDKNRAIAYITDGEKKSFHGIEVDRFMSRTFLLTARDKANNNRNFISIVRQYPISIGFADILNNEIGGEYNFFENLPNKNCVSRYFFEVLTHELFSKRYEKFCYMYLDNTYIKFPRKNKAHFPMRYAYHKFGGGGYPDIAIMKPYYNQGFKSEEELYFEWCDGLSGLIEQRLELQIESSRVDEIQYA